MTTLLSQQLKKLQEASLKLGTSSVELRNQVLINLKELLLKHAPEILKANQRDLKKLEEDDPLYDRLELTEKRIAGIAAELEKVAELSDPIGRVLQEYDAPSGMHIKKISVPLGCIGVIFESRPNVTVDVAGLCIKSGNAVLLRGGSDAYETNKVLHSLIQKALKKTGLPPSSVELLKPDRKLVDEMMTADQYLDVIIPRGGASLIERVRKNSTVPVIETGASVVHTFVDATADQKMACEIILNEKTRRPTVCNAVDTILIDRSIAKEFLPKLARTMLPSETIVHADQESFEILKNRLPEELLKEDAEDHYATEFLSLQMNVHLVKGIDEAIEHIRTYSLKHSESIVTKNEDHAEKFLREVDAACVYVNTSTAFSDGAQFGLGSEIGISTQKLHARGPMGLEALTSYKWVVTSNGLVRK